MSRALSLFFNQNTTLGAYLTLWLILLSFHLTWIMFGPESGLETATYLLLQGGLLLWTFRAAYLQGKRQVEDERHPN